MGNISENSWLKRVVMHFLSDKEFERMEKASAFLNFKKGETILKQGNQPTHVAFLQSGVVKFNYENGLNKNIILSIVAAPKILGGANLFYKDNNLFSIIAVENCEIIFIDSRVLLELLSNNGKFAVALYQIGSEMYKKAIMNFISLASKQKEGRIADILLYISEDVYRNSSFVLPVTRKEMSEFACCSPENVIMTLSRWHTEKIINICNKQIEITNVEKLRQISKMG